MTDSRTPQSDRAAPSHRPPRPKRPIWATARFVLIRDMLIFVVGTWYFEFHVDYVFPEENNLLLYFVAVPIIWSTLIHIWTTTSYREQGNPAMLLFTHLIAVMSLISTVFLISATLNTIAATLDSIGMILFHFVGWTVILSLVYYDVVDIKRL